MTSERKHTKDLLPKENAYESVWVDEGQLILLKQRARKRHKSMSKIIRELIEPPITEIADMPAEEQSIRLSQARSNIEKRYRDYYKEYYGPEKPGSKHGPYPFMGINCLLPEQLMDSSADLAAKIDASRDQFLSEVLNSRLPQLNKA